MLSAAESRKTTSDERWRIEAIKEYVLALVRDRHNEDTERSQASYQGNEILDWLEIIEEMERFAALHPELDGWLI